jgi:hypothetical protein
MQRTDVVALVVGAFVGVWGGMLGAFLVCTGSREVLYRFLSHSENKRHTLVKDERISRYGFSI